MCVRAHDFFCETIPVCLNAQSFSFYKRLCFGLPCMLTNCVHFQNHAEDECPALRGGKCVLVYVSVCVKFAIFKFAMFTAFQISDFPRSYYIRH